MGRIHVLPDHVANKIAAGEVVERPASVVKELVENALDAGAQHIRVSVEAGGKKLIQVSDDGCGMLRDDALLAFERHATSKIKDADDLLSVRTLGFRGEALPSIGSVSRLTLETGAASPAGTSTAEGSAPAMAGTRLEIAGGKLLRVEEAGLPAGTSITVRDLFFNVPARKKFLRAEATELSHIASLVTHYALAHPQKHFELHSSANAMLLAPPVSGEEERVFQIFGRDTLRQLLPLAAELQLERAGLPEPPPWKRGPDYVAAEPGTLRLHGFTSRPEVQKLNRNSVFIFVNQRLVRDRLIQHALTEAYRNILPAGLYPVALLFLEMPGAEVDVNVHPSKTEVRFRQQQQVHDFVRDSVRAALLKARPVAEFVKEIGAQPTASPALTPMRAAAAAEAGGAAIAEASPGLLAQAGNDFALRAPSLPPQSAPLQFPGDAIEVHANAARALAPSVSLPVAPLKNAANCGGALPESAMEEQPANGASIAALKPLGQIQNSFILATGADGLWIIDQHVAHERVLFERVLARAESKAAAAGQTLLMPMVVELTPAQLAVFAEIREELERNGFEAELFGSRSIAIKAAPAGIEPHDVERLLHELLENCAREDQAMDFAALRRQVAASIACHAAIKINTPLEPEKMHWLLGELSRTECPISCPHGRPVLLRYSLRDIQRAFKRI